VSGQRHRPGGFTPGKEIWGTFNNSLGRPQRRSGRLTIWRPTATIWVVPHS